MQRFIDTLQRNIWWCAISLVIVPALAGLAGHQFLRAFDATASIWVDGPATANMTDPTAPKSSADSYATTFQELLLTRAFQDKVIQGAASRTGVPVPSGANYDALVTRVRSSIKVATAGPNLITIDYRDSDATAADATERVLVDAFLTEALTLKRDAAQRTIEQYDQQVAQARTNVKNADIAAILNAPVPDSVGLSQAVDLQSRLDHVKALEDKRNAAYAQAVADTLSVSATLHVIDAPYVATQAKTNWTQVALAIIASLVMAVAVDAVILTILMLLDRTVHGPADLPAISRVAVSEMPRVQPRRLSDNWS